MDCTMKHSYRPRTEFLICGDINVNCLMEFSYKTTVFIIDYLLIQSIVLQELKSVKVQQYIIFLLIILDNMIFSATPIVNGLSDHNGQYLILQNFFNMIKTRRSTSRTMLLCKDSISDFKSSQKMKKGVICINLMMCKIHLTHF